MPRSPRRSSSPERDRSRRGRSDEGRDCKKDRGDYEDRRRDRDDHRDSRRDRDEHRDRRRDWDDDEDADRKRSREDHTDRKREQSDKGSRVGGNDAKESTISTSRPETKTSHSPDKKYGLVPSQKDDDEEKPLIVKQEPNFNLSGKLAEEQLTVNGIVLKFSQPPEARMPDKLWRLYVFKEDQHVDTLHIHRQPSFLFGRDRGIVDVPIDHPSCSKQHAALVYRPKTSTASGSTTREIRFGIQPMSRLFRWVIKGSQI
eukprot:TRINITY_DN92_c0_g1_i2.p1 TRINITY_DN92_c0_g1~~TRINITY_DN92_c0_g1_i2.p1  ORF type:complete len:258 (-),score=36.55 TRINITY_DN92_c0_g1_i2:931-1704(-)